MFPTTKHKGNGWQELFPIPAFTSSSHPKELETIVTNHPWAIKMEKPLPKIQIALTEELFLPLTYTLTSFFLFSPVLSSLTFSLYQPLISPCATGLQAVRAVWSTTGGCRHITSSGTVIIWLFYCWMCCWRSAWGESNIFFATKFLGGDSTAASCSEHRLPKLPEVMEIRTQAFRDCQTPS